MCAAPEPIIPTLEADVRGMVRLGLVRAQPVKISDARPPLREEIEQVCESMRAEHAGKPPAEIPGIQMARQLYRAFGIDPTRTRPSSEALLRRILRGKPFPSVSNAVDLCNLTAVAFLLPLGLYDAEKIEGPVSLRRGAASESFEGIRKDAVHLVGRPTLADARGPFGNPTSDSLRTSVSEQTRSLWIVVFAPASADTGLLQRYVDYLCAGTKSHTRGPDVEVQAHGMLV